MIYGEWGHIKIYRPESSTLFLYLINTELITIEIKKIPRPLFLFCLGPSIRNTKRAAIFKFPGFCQTGFLRREQRSRL
jgi:hypothetical protein